MKRFTCLAWSVILLTLLAGCAIPVPDKRPAEQIIDLSSVPFSTRDGSWQREHDAEGMYIQQDRATGGHTYFWFDYEVPDAFLFEAELGVISGNNPDNRPYFGLIFNAQKDKETGEYGQGYRYAFNPLDPQYRLERLGSGGGQIASLTAHEDAKWEWDLQEWRILRVIRTDDKIDLYVDGKLLISHTDETYKNGAVGFWTYSTSAVFRNIKLISLSQ